MDIREVVQKMRDTGEPIKVDGNWSLCGELFDEGTGEWLQENGYIQDSGLAPDGFVHFTLTEDGKTHDINNLFNL